MIKKGDFFDDTILPVAVAYEDSRKDKFILEGLVNTGQVEVIDQYQKALGNKKINFNCVIVDGRNLLHTMCSSNSSPSVQFFFFIFQKNKPQINQHEGQRWRNPTSLCK